MAEQTTETTQVPPVVTPPATTEQGAAAATTTPPASKTSTEQTTTPPTETTPPAANKLPPEEVQKRIDRMYARLQAERKQRLAAEAQAHLHKPATTGDEETEEDGTQQPKGLTEADINVVIERREREKKFQDSEMHVFERHPTALNEDGSFNMSDPFVQRYIEIGRRNPMLAMMENGPELAEAMADKEMGVDFKKGRTTEAARAQAANNSFTTTSTTIPAPSTTTGTLTPEEKKVAARTGMSDAEYIKQKSSNKVVQKDWTPKPRQ